MDAWIAAPEYDEPPLQYKDAMQLEPMQAPPKRMFYQPPDSVSHESVNLERQIVTPLTDSVEQARRNTTSTAPFGGSTVCVNI